MDEIFKHWTSLLSVTIEAGAAIVIGFAAIQAIIRAIVDFFRPSGLARTDSIRLRLGQWLSLALEFEVAADILRTAIAPTWTDIGQLGAIVMLRTVLNYFLQKEISTAKAGRESETLHTRMSPEPGKAA